MVTPGIKSLRHTFKKLFRKTRSTNFQQIARNLPWSHNGRARDQIV